MQNVSASRRWYKDKCGERMKDRLRQLTLFVQTVETGSFFKRSA
jgi:hypothetical protein